MKLIEIVSNVEVLNELAKVSLPIKASYSINRLIKKLAPELEIYNEQRVKLLKEYGKLTEDGKEYKFEGEGMAKFQGELSKLLDTEVSVDFIKIKISELGDIKIEPRLLIDLVFE